MKTSGNLIWHIPFLGFVSATIVFLLFITIIGIPVALVVSNSLGSFFNPVKKICVPATMAEELERRHAHHHIDSYQRERRG